MNVLFLTLLSFNSLQDRNIYTDLLREFVKHDHQVCVIAPMERRERKETHVIKEKNAMILRLKTGNTQKSNIIEKGISTVMIGAQFKVAIRKYFKDVKFDLILYSTPPITLVSAIEYVKKRDDARTYLLLKDIFPQNAVDIGMMNTAGIKSVLYKHFRSQEMRLYAVSDRIGCMSQANVDYVLKHNLDVMQKNDATIKQNGKPIIEICPNSIEPIDMSISREERYKLRSKYNIPEDKKVFVYGGNLGKPQGIPFMLECLDSQRDNEDVFFLIVGSGTEYHLIEEYVNTEHLQNVVLYQALSKEDYDKLVAACDVGMIFLDHRFTVPNFPSRLLSYMQAKIPVLAVTDLNTDIRNVITGIDNDDGRRQEVFGWWCESDDVRKFRDIIRIIIGLDRQTLKQIGEIGYQYLLQHYSVKKSYKIIVKDISEGESVNG